MSHGVPVAGEVLAPSGKWSQPTCCRIRLKGENEEDVFCRDDSPSNSDSEDPRGRKRMEAPRRQTRNKKGGSGVQCPILHLFLPFQFFYDECSISFFYDVFHFLFFMMSVPFPFFL